MNVWEIQSNSIVMTRRRIRLNQSLTGTRMLVLIVIFPPLIAVWSELASMPSKVSGVVQLKKTRRCDVLKRIYLSEEGDHRYDGTCVALSFC